MEASPISRARFLDTIQLAGIATQGKPQTFNEFREKLIERYDYDVYRDIWRDACEWALYTSAQTALHARVAE
jgi:hypothetical protein